MKTAATIAALLLFTLLVIVAVVPAPAFSTADSGTPIRDHLLQNGVQETGAINLVTAVYLGYRLYDTLGEAIVLLLAVSAVLFFLESRP